jgi:protein SCO1/2
MLQIHRACLQSLAILVLDGVLASGQAPFATPIPTRELAVGEVLPDIELINQLNEKIRLSDFRGQPLAITFIYSRCPSPTLCPMVSRNFDVAQTLLARMGSSEKSHLLSISLDVEHDTPEVLAAYAKTFSADSRLWTFATAREEDLRRIGAAVGLEFKHIDGRIDHNLRTVVVNSAGRIHRIFRGNAWTPQELVAELRGAALAHE